jgi:hypothetical protein
MNYEALRISKLRQYLFDVISNLTNNTNYQINADMLGEIDNYSLDKMPTNTNIEQWIIGTKKKRDVYSFRSRKSYSQDTIDNLLNIGFFERFENIINSNNDRGILPDIENVESIECLNSGTMLSSDNGNSAIFDIQIQITYINNEDNGGVSL